MMEHDAYRGALRIFAAIERDYSGCGKNLDDGYAIAAEQISKD
jgi:hypothetical protein